MALGVRLFHRTTREVRLTGAGHAFLPAARRVLSEAARARAEVSAAAGVPRGQIRLGATQTASGSLDLAGLPGEFRRLPLARRDPVSLAEIADRGRVWNFGQVPSCAATLTPPSGRPGSAGRSRSNWGQLTVRFARAGLGAAIVPRSFTTDLAAPRRRPVGVLGLADRGLGITIDAYTRSEAALPAAAALLDLAARRDELCRPAR